MAFSVSDRTLDDLLRHTYNELVASGAKLSATRGSTLEIVGASLELENPLARLSLSESRRRLVSGLAELNWYLTGTSDTGTITHYIPIYANEIESDGSIRGAYGPRIFGNGDNNQIRNIIELLKEKPHTRRAVVQIFDKSDISKGKRFKDIPCTTTMQFLLRDGCLSLIVTMRSNDAYLGLPHDIFVFTMIQEIVARSLNCELGRYIHNVGSLHLYEERLDDVEAFLKEGWQSTDSSMKPMPSGAQWAYLEQLSAAEGELRSSGSFDEINLPSHAYWADLVRVLAHWEAAKRGNTTYAGRMQDAITDGTLREFVRVKSS
ncbi:thymidylate synthase [Rhodococcoides yunnanense]|uniref:thymidylate synthase n=1 Tax=Rhodococcoides yunnanense TaxID=278209 RepID=A0ABU4BIJ0_9NOCA|nr:thymidylate synthase [Rhodococcus yunnanensis]MDV6263889.1 thymidylate synthase [Rhodococcus yunnanensis]